MANKLDLADAQFIGFVCGKWSGVIDLVESMGLTKAEWEKWKKDYSNVLDDYDFEQVEIYFNEKTNGKNKKNINQFLV